MGVIGVKENIESFIKERGIENLYHFTKSSNLNGILSRGLLSRKNMDDNDIQYDYNDELRLEGKLGSVCLSISYPNYKMLYTYVLEDKSTEWCIIELDPRILYDKKCLLCKENAASNNETDRCDYDKVGLKGLKALFDDNELRKKLNLSNELTTNPQAEVLVLGDIEVDYIKEVYFKTSDVKFDFTKHTEFNFSWYRDIFYGRHDHEYWRK